ncbi:hypothetical protein [Halobaculum sp. EA56]|uniref:hypothetical protein n=1 Tax=Halobaculum sp. EA56 TaxID=3421648 RepID=UPI003EB793DB
MDDLVAAARESLSAETRAAFVRRVERQAAALAADIEAGRLDNADFALGIELEAYVVDPEGRLARVPEAVFERTDAGRELGVHNLELHTEPDTFDPAGLARQAERLREAVAAVRAALPEDRRLALDATWTVPPPEGSAAYLSAHDEREGVTVARNMTDAARYVALDNETLRRADGRVPLSAPGVDRTFPTILPESLTASLQPHLQLPEASSLPRYHAYALRTTGPVLALATNSPFLPADLYDDDADPEAVLSGPHEHRIRVFEETINAGLPPDRSKVRFPRDLDSAAEALDCVAADEPYAPVLEDGGTDTPEGGDAAGGERANAGDDDTEFLDAYPEFDHARGTYWRWVRPVFGGAVPTGPRGERTAANDDASVRLEYRPLPTQPSVADAVAFQALVAGLLRELVATDHPLADLPWEAARDSFYAAAADGPNADLAWVTREGERTADPSVVVEEVLDLAGSGLRRAGCSRATATDLLAPVADRVAEAGDSPPWRAPSAWKRERARELLADGATLSEAVVGAQRAYLERAEGDEPFAAWA